jgi:hypothetical protein
VSIPFTNELTPPIMPKPSQVRGPTTIIKHSDVTSAAAVRGLNHRVSKSNTG